LLEERWSRWTTSSETNTAATEFPIVVDLHADLHENCSTINQNIKPLQKSLPFDFSRELGVELHLALQQKQNK
jgi:fructose/tagatose bisphosphate aldolase